MTHQQIIELAREAGANVMMLLTDPPRLGIVQMHPQHLEKFAALVAAKEREAIAKQFTQPYMEYCGIQIQEIIRKGETQ